MQAQIKNAAIIFFIDMFLQMPEAADCLVRAFFSTFSSVYVSMTIDSEIPAMLLPILSTSEDDDSSNLFFDIKQLNGTLNIIVIQIGS